MITDCGTEYYHDIALLAHSQRTKLCFEYSMLTSSFPPKLLFEKYDDPYLEIQLFLAFDLLFSLDDMLPLSFVNNIWHT